MEELLKLGDIEAVRPEDGLLRWAAQGDADGRLAPGVRAWHQDGAVAVAHPGLSHRDRLIVRGSGSGLVAVTRQALDVMGPGFAPFGPAEAIETLLAAMPELAPLYHFYWMETAAPTGASHQDARWLGPAEELATAALIDEHFADSHARPGRAGVRRWAGILGPRAGSPAPEPLAVGAETWSTQGLGFVAGVVTHPEARGRGLARAVCAFLTDALVELHGRCALLVHHDNPAAIATYDRLGYARHAFRSAQVR